ncbi:Methionine aminopeptidase 1D, chloroplastic/mitochondrial, partial [Cucurbita argyrosperma subsp. argyrosperma]
MTLLSLYVEWNTLPALIGVLGVGSLYYRNMSLLGGSGDSRKKKIPSGRSDHADKHRFGVVRQFVGHGVGRVFHADPVILHFRNNDGGRMVSNQTFTIEPMLTMGSINPVMWDDNWTVVTEDGSLSAQFEHTILITDDGAEILTQC